MKSCLCDLFSSCWHQSKISKIWGIVLLAATPKPMKPMGDPKSYQPMSLFYVPYKILERLIYAGVEPTIHSLFPKKETGFQREKSIMDKTILLTQNMKDSFKAKSKAGTVFVILTATPDTVWNHGLTCTLLRFLPDNHIIRMIMELIQNQVLPLLPVRARKTVKKYCFSGISLGFFPFKHLYIQILLHNF